jgi:hypothetical protein
MKFKLLFFKKKSSLVKMLHPTILLDSPQRNLPLKIKIFRLKDREKRQRSSVTWTSHHLTLGKVTLQRAA